MFTKRNIAIYFGLLLALMSVCVSTAAAENIELGLSVSPENLVIGTNAKWISVVFHVEDAYKVDGVLQDVEDCPYTAENIKLDYIELEIEDSFGNLNVVEEPCDRTEITDADGDGYNETVFIYEAIYLLNDELKYNNKGLEFRAKGALDDGNIFTASCHAKTTMIKGGNKGGEGKPENPGNGGGKPENPGNGR